ncbi:MAG TPA: c-type cytochrome [Casimicrobiaceae bacterium]|nr:c-type cytochrome [Casimicrobiaceae bacterium]
MTTAIAGSAAAIAQQPAASVAKQPTAAVAPQPAGNATRGRELVQQCQGCHGIAGWRTAFPEVYHVPKLAGQHATYIVAALNAYRSGARSHPSMRAIAASLSDADIADLAAYYSAPTTHTAAK